MMAKRIAATTANRLRRRIFSVSFWTRGTIIGRSVYRLAAGRFEEHLFERLRAALGVEDVHASLDQRGDEWRRVTLLDGDPDAIGVSAKGEIAFPGNRAGSHD